MKEDAPLFFFRYVDRVGLAEQCECGSQSKIPGKAAWRHVLKDGRPSNDDKYAQTDNGKDDDGGDDEEMPLEDTKSSNKDGTADAGSSKRLNDACTSRQASAEISAVKNMKCGHAADTPESEQT